jgi:hypothetical protein
MTNDERDAAVHCLRELSEVCAPIYEEALRLAIAALEAQATAEPVTEEEARVAWLKYNDHFETPIQSMRAALEDFLSRRADQCR